MSYFACVSGCPGPLTQLETTGTSTPTATSTPAVKKANTIAASRTASHCASPSMNDAIDTKGSAGRAV